MKLAVIGTGYVGLVAGAGFAERGHHVTCVDIDEKRIANLYRGILPIYEPGLDSIVEEQTRIGRLGFSTSTRDSVRGVDAVFIAVGTPPSEDGSADLSHVLSAAREIAHSITGDCVIVNKSTVPVGTGALVEEVFREHADHRVHVVSNPEFLREGCAIGDFLDPERVVVGCESQIAEAVMRGIYQPFIDATGATLHTMDRVSAELTKYAANCMLATRISFMNELSVLANKLGANIDNVRVGIGSDSRIGPQFLRAGIGFGGSCFPKDIRALLKMGEEQEVPLSIVQSAHDANERQKRVLARMVTDHFGPSLKGVTVALWGLSFKPETDDIRESPAIEVARELVRAGANVRAFDPEAMSNARNHLGWHIDFVDSKEDALVGANALVLATEWNCFGDIDFSEIRRYMEGHVVFDGRNVWDQDAVARAGLSYYGIGRPQRLAPVTRRIKAQVA